MNSRGAAWRLIAAIGGLAVMNMGGCPLLLGGGLLVGLFDGLLDGDPNAATGDPNNVGDPNQAAGPGNAAPTVDAGGDRTVLRGEMVTLTGSASDSDGDALAVLWEQTGGAAVTLSGATTLTATFTAPSTPGTLTFRLTADDGNGHVVSATAAVEVTTPPAFLFVANNDSGRITAHNSANLDGQIAPSTALNAGAATSLFQVRSILVTPGGMLFASRQNGGIVVYDDALAADADTPADRVIDGAKTLLDTPVSLAYDAASDTLYVGNANAENGILAFADATKPGLAGDVAPSRIFAPADRFPHSGSVRMTIDAMWIAPDGSLYASDTSGLNANSSRILVWSKPGEANGQAPADREITSASFGNIEDLAMDAQGRLYVVDGTNNIYVFDAPSGLDGAVTPDATITLNGSPTPQLHGVAVDASGVGYVSDRQNDAIYSLADIATLDGATPVDTVLEGFDSRIAGPRQIWIYEP